MTVSSSINRVVQTGNGATTVWNYSFLIPDASEVVVQIADKTTGVVTTLTTLQYSITGIGNPSGGTVTYTPALTTNQTITIQRILPVTQGTSLSNQGAFYPTVLETALDYLTMVCQQLNDATGRALVISPNGVGTIDAQTNRIINVVNAVNAQDAVTLAQLQAQFAASGNVPSPTLGQVGQYLKATGTGIWAWAVAQVTSANITDSTAAGRALLTGADATAQRSSLGLGVLAVLSSVTNTELAANAVAGTNVQANVLTFAKFQRTGSVGQVWTSGGAGADASYVGSMTLLASGTASSVATLDLALPSGYKTFCLVLTNILPATNAVTLNARFSQDGGSTYVSSASYGHAGDYAGTDATRGGYGATGTTSAIVAGGRATLPNASALGTATLWINPGNASYTPSFSGFGANYTSPNMYFGYVGGYLAVNALATNIRLLMSSGNISNMVYALYGVN